MNKIDNKLDMNFMAQRKNLGKEQLAKIAVGNLEKKIKSSMKQAAPPAGYPGVGKTPKKTKGGIR